MVPKDASKTTMKVVGLEASFFILYGGLSGDSEIIKIIVSLYLNVLNRLIALPTAGRNDPHAQQACH